MAKKKKSRRKAQQKVHRSSRSAQPPIAKTTASVPLAATSETSSKPKATPTTPAVAVTSPTVGLSASTSARWVYVRHDLRRVAIFALVSIGLEAIAWVVLNHTGAGPALFNSLKI